MYKYIEYYVLFVLFSVDLFVGCFSFLVTFNDTFICRALRPVSYGSASFCCSFAWYQKQSHFLIKLFIENGFYICIYICMCICVCVCIYICIYIYMYTQLHMIIFCVFIDIHTRYLYINT